MVMGAALRRNSGLAFSLALLLSVSIGCAVGPRYAKPATISPARYKETPENWKTAEPSDQLARGKWWEIYGDAQLNAFEEQIAVSNQNLKAAQAQYQQARALVRLNRANYYPSITAGLSAARTHNSSNRPLGNVALSNSTDIVIPVDVSWEPDVFGRIRKTVEVAHSNAQASAADLESVSLSLHAELA